MQRLSAKQDALQPKMERELKPLQQDASERERGPSAGRCRTLMDELKADVGKQGEDVSPPALQAPELLEEFDISEEKASEETDVFSLENRTPLPRIEEEEEGQVGEERVHKSKK